MWLANIAFERLGVPEESRWIRSGKIWHDRASDKTSLFFSGLALSKFVAKPFEEKDLPFISGDLVAYLFSTRTYLAKIESRPQKQWCGYVSTEQNEKGTLYFGAIEVIPMIKADTGIFLKVEEYDTKHTEEDKHSSPARRKA